MTDDQRAIYTTASRPRDLAPKLVIGMIIAGLGATGLWRAIHDDSTRDERVRLTMDGRTVLAVRAADVAAWDGKTLRRRLRELDARRRARRGRSAIELETDYAATARRVRALAADGGGDAPVAERAVAASVSIPVVKQRLRNNCESAALAMLLQVEGRAVDQLTLQRELPRSGPLDPEARPDGTRVWGDPDVGYVGRPDGGGTAGGYGVYQAPVSAVARRRGLDLADLTGEPASRVYDALRQGRPVMAWIGLSDGPYETWRTPEGRQVTGNFGEHTVVLTGIRGDVLDVNDPLSGRRLRWSRDEFELMWKRLGDRALAL